VAGVVARRPRDRRRRAERAPASARAHARRRLGRPLAIPPVDALAVPRWSPTGRWILYEEGTEEGVFVWRARPDGTRARRLARGSRHTWSPSGRRFAYSERFIGMIDWQPRPTGARPPSARR
jgi:hypothetical protein